MANPRLLRSTLLLVVAGVPALLGCNVQDYEARMVRAQATQKARDDENQALDGPAELPPYKEGGTGDIFLRLPLGINPQANNPDKPVNGLLFHYLRKTPPAAQAGMNPNPNPNPRTIDCWPDDPNSRRRQHAPRDPLRGCRKS